MLGQAPTRSERYEAYRREWDRREVEMDPDALAKGELVGRAVLRP